MNFYRKLLNALENEVPVLAVVRLYNGETRVRIGPVANLTSSHVTFFDIGKGFRTAPLQLVAEVKLNHAEKRRFKPAFDAMKAAVKS